MSKPTEDPPKERAKESSIANFCDSGKTNEELVNKLRATEILKTDEIIQAFLKVDRGKFLPPELKDKAYEDTPLRCKYEGGIVHQSAPHMYAHILEHMQIKPGHAILNVGSGTGYLSTLFAWFAGSEGTNHGVELYRSNVVFAQRHALMEMFREGSFAPIVFFSENIFNMNVNKNIQYDRIYVGANCKREVRIDIQCVLFLFLPK
jgi:protein-L-isoaspartate(D-aspartate) O-methyltransferase